MATNKKPRKKYRPKPVLADPVGFVTEGLAPVAQTDLTTIALLNSSAMAALMRGAATKKDMDVLVAMSNISEALVFMGFGADGDCVKIAADGREAILAIVWRAVKVLKFVPTGPEIKALNLLMELHDAQMEVITVQELCQALERVKSHIRKGNCDRLPEPVHPKV